MKEKITAVAFNLRNLLWRLEELRDEIDKEGKRGKWNNIYDLQKAINNLASVLIVAEDNLKEIEELFKSKTRNKKIKIKREREDS